MIAASFQQLADNLLAIRKSRDFAGYKTFDEYAKRVLSLSKTKARQWCNFSTFCRMCREENLPPPVTPDNVAAILGMPQKTWMSTWRYCVDMSATNAQQIAELGVVQRKRVPEHILKARQVKKAAKTFAELEDGERVVDLVGPDGLGRHWPDAVRFVIEADQSRMDEQGRS